MKNKTWTKYTFVCDPDECDTLIEVTCDDYGFPLGVMQVTCPCGRKLDILSVANATIESTTTEGEPVLDNLEARINLDSTPTNEYNPNQLVTYKKLNGYSDPEIITEKVTSLEWDLHNGRQASKHNAVLQSKIDNVKEIITESYADSEDQETLRSIAEALNIELTRTIEWSATIEVSGTMDVDLLEDVDIEQEIYDNLYVDSQNGNIEIGDTEVCNAREC
jgi:hypothetical protein